MNVLKIILAIVNFAFASVAYLALRESKDRAVRGDMIAIIMLLIIDIIMILN